MKARRAWRKYEELEDRMVEYLLWDFTKKTNGSVSKKKMEANRRHFKIGYTFEKKAAKIERLFRLKDNPEEP